MPNTLFPHAAEDLKGRLDADEMVHRTNAFDWSQTELGAMSDWPEALRSAVRLMLSSDVPMVMLAGERDGLLIYNAGYSAFAGARHPAIFGQPVLTAWPEIADFNHGNMLRGFAGESWYLADQELVLNRTGKLEPAYMNLNYSPVRDETGKVLAILVIVVETTQRFLAERALAENRARLELALDASGMVGTWEWDIVADRVTADERFARLFAVDPDAARVGLSIGAFLDAIHEDDRPRVEAEIEQAVAEGGQARFSYRIQQPDGTTRWVDASGMIILDEGGRPLRFPGVVVDITDQRQIAEQLAESEMRFRTLADTMPQMVWSTLPDGFHDYYNARWYEFTGVPEGSTDGEAWNGMFHPADQARAWETWRHSLRTGEPYRIEYRLRHHSGNYRWVLGQALPIRDAAGKITRWFGTCTDIHEDKLAAEERELIAEELSHRIKNIFAVTGGIISLAARSHPEAADFADKLRGRVMALGRAHDFVRPHSRHSAAAGSPTLQALVEQLLEPYIEEGRDRISFSGDDVEIDDGAATPLALLIHELATNAAKYGALSSPEGFVRITGRMQGGDYVLGWHEHGATPVPSERAGFGSRLISLSVEGQLHGRMDRQFAPDGLRLDVTIPRDALSRKAALQAPSQDP